MTLIATTLGIVPSKPQGHPIPTITKEEATEMRKAGGEDLDSWEYLQLRIKHHNTRERIQSALEAAKDDKKSSREEIILKRLEKGRKLDENPSSLATGITHRVSLNYEAKENKGSQKDKRETVAIACRARDMDKSSIVECRKLKALSRRAENDGSPTKKQKGSKGSRTALQDISNSAAMANRRSDNKCPDTDTMPMMEEEEKPNGNGTKIIELIDSEDEDTSIQQEGGMVRGMMNLVTLTTRDLETLDRNKLVNDACIDALGDILQYSVDVTDISICHTGFWAAVEKHGWGIEAKKFIHPDPEDVETEGWQAHKFTRGHLESKVLMIPCNFPGESKVEVGHWILAIRERGEKGHHKLHILDSLGKSSGISYRTKIARALRKTPIFPQHPKGKAFATEQQKECECGARVAKYMEDLIHLYQEKGGKDSITKLIGKAVQWEKIQGKNEVANCRDRIKKKLEGEQRNLYQKKIINIGKV
jgi:hypothetical protein